MPRPTLRTSLASACARRLSTLMPALMPALASALMALLAAPAAAAPADIDTRAVPAGPTRSALPEGWHHGAFMRIFVRAWRDSNGDGIGDLRGLTQSLDELQDLGVRGLWLKPVTAPDPAGHGHATPGFHAIAPEYGTLADFDALLREAHQRGIGVVMDHVIHPGAAPHPPLLQSQQDSLRFWLNRGLDGVRLELVPQPLEGDAVRLIDAPERRALLQPLQDLINAYEHRYLVCETTACLPGLPGHPDIFASHRLLGPPGGDVRAYKLAAASYLLQPGTPFIHHGEDLVPPGVPEVGVDPPLRALAPNAATNPLRAQRADPASLFNFYKAMLKLRNELPSLARGAQEHGFAQGLVAGGQRVHEGERTLVLINHGPQLAQAEMRDLPPNARLLSAFPPGGAQAARANASGQASLWLGPQAVRVLVVDSGMKTAARKSGKPAKAVRAQAVKPKATKAKATQAKATPTRAKKAAPAAAQKAKAAPAPKKPAVP